MSNDKEKCLNSSVVCCLKFVLELKVIKFSLTSFLLLQKTLCTIVLPSSPLCFFHVLWKVVQDLLSSKESFLKFFTPEALFNIGTQFSSFTMLYLTKDSLLVYLSDTNLHSI